eukprot:TRINITY_DN32556_c0_g1_i1.p1 TRINITY_DN32556_c0_g1~~TRINITY_DN32556_c0_g1_i1.p1  ORF type:complete len:159 (+),score=42.34 TRINITY_DN32556_c0_g1_i1:46-477(+)
MLRSLVGSEMCIRDSFWMTDENSFRRTPRDCSRRAAGTTCMMSDEDEASMRASNGAITVVFPCPMIICSTRESPAAWESTNAWTNSTCRARSRNPDRNSNSKNLGSSAYPSPSSWMLMYACLLYTSDAADEEDSVDLRGRRIF